MQVVDGVVLHTVAEQQLMEPRQELVDPDSIDLDENRVAITTNFSQEAASVIGVAMLYREDGRIRAYARFGDDAPMNRGPDGKLVFDVAVALSGNRIVMLSLLDALHAPQPSSTRWTVEAAYERWLEEHVEPQEGHSD
jgi:hypothetical protein